MPRIRRHQETRPEGVDPSLWAYVLRVRAEGRAAWKARVPVGWKPSDEPSPDPQGPLIYHKDIAAYRAAWEARQRRDAETAAWKANPEAQAELARAIEGIRTAGPPWEREGWQPTVIPDAEERARRLHLMHEYAMPRWLGVPHLVRTELTEKPEKIKSMVKLKAARKKVLTLAGEVRDEAFKSWLAEWVVDAERPDKWTQSRVLYENYLKRAKDYGNNKWDKRLSKEELATETQWGKMMGATYMKKRRAGGNYYPVRLKRGA